MVMHRLHGIERVPPCTGRTQQLLRYKVHLLFFSHSEHLKLLLQNMKSMLHIQRLRGRRECGWVHVQEILLRTGSIRTAGTTPIPAIAAMASTGEATNRLG